MLVNIDQIQLQHIAQSNMLLLIGVPTCSTCERLQATLVMYIQTYPSECQLITYDSILMLCIIDEGCKHIDVHLTLN
jgi:hypothetical protein